jgi:ppGpp synthetase/RelA/SpoT-type nucleotidyltranferase
MADDAPTTAKKLKLNKTNSFADKLSRRKHKLLADISDKKTHNNYAGVRIIDNFRVVNH